MPCALTQGMARDCRDANGGVADTYVAEWDNVTAVVASAGVVTSITKATGKRFWKYQFPQGTASYTETITASKENGTIYYTQALKMALNKMQANTRNELLLLGKNYLMVVVADATGKYWLMGYRKGAMVSGGSSSTGTAMGDRNGYEIDITADEPEFALEVNSATLATLETPGA